MTKVKITEINNKLITVQSYLKSVNVIQKYLWEKLLNDKSLTDFESKIIEFLNKLNFFIGNLIDNYILLQDIHLALSFGLQLKLDFYKRIMVMELKESLEKIDALWTSEIRNQFEEKDLKSLIGNIDANSKKLNKLKEREIDKLKKFRNEISAHKNVDAAHYSTTIIELDTDYIIINADEFQEYSLELIRSCVELVKSFDIN